MDSGPRGAGQQLDGLSAGKVTRLRLGVWIRLVAEFHKTEDTSLKPSEQLCHELAATLIYPLRASSWLRAESDDGRAARRLLLTKLEARVFCFVDVSYSLDFKPGMLERQIIVSLFQRAREILEVRPSARGCGLGARSCRRAAPSAALAIEVTLRATAATKH